jgi:hypothetical protein
MEIDNFLTGGGQAPLPASPLLCYQSLFGHELWPSRMTRET